MAITVDSDHKYFYRLFHYNELLFLPDMEDLVKTNFKSERLKIRKESQIQEYYLFDPGRGYEKPRVKPGAKDKL
jgi:hypothetical protein